MSEDGERQRLQWVLALVLTAVIVGGTTDLILDSPSNWLSGHVLFELTLMVGAAAVMIALWRGWFRAESSLVDARASLKRHAAERERWRASAEAAVAGFRAAIDQQFDTWGLTDAERSVAMQLLQGESHKVIARVTNRSERTVRQHAVAVYQKSGLRGRAELAAYFLDDLLATQAASTPSAGGQRG